MYSYRRFLVFGLNLGDSDSKKVDTAAWWWVKSFRDRGRHVSMIKSKTTSFFGAGWSEFTYLSPDSVTTVRTLWMSPWLCWRVSWQCRCQHLQLKLSYNESINVKSMWLTVWREHASSNEVRSFVMALQLSQPRFQRPHAITRQWRQQRISNRQDVDIMEYRYQNRFMLHAEVQ